MILEAELGHKVASGTQPLTLDALTSKLATLKSGGTQVGDFIRRYQTDSGPVPKALPTRARRAAEVAAAMRL